MLIGLVGCKGVGKDTVGQYLIDNYEFTKLAFADKVKEALANLFDITVKQVDEFKTEYADGIPYREVVISHIDRPVEWRYTWREFLQRFGTEMGRNTFGQNFWIQQWENSYTALSVMEPDAFKKVVVTDVRFENEAHAILTAGGWLVEITRKGHEPDGHASEEGIDEKLVDVLIINNGTLEDLYQDVDKLMEGLANARK